MIAHHPPRIIHHAPKEQPPLPPDLAARCLVRLDAQRAEELAHPSGNPSTEHRLAERYRLDRLWLLRGIAGKP